MRRVDDAAAAALVGVVEVFEDLQTVLRCCERLVTELAVEGEPDPVVVEAVWTTACCPTRAASQRPGTAWP